MEYEAGLAGLELNHAKTELVCDDVVTCNAVLSALSEFKQFFCDRAIYTPWYSYRKCWFDRLNSRVKS